MVAQRLPLVLSVKCSNWRMFDKGSADADAEFERVRKQALERDNYTCRFCGFRALKWQEVHHANDDHADNRLENLVTACTFCHNCQHIGFAGTRKEAVLIFLPEISQANLHHVVRTALVATRMNQTVASDRHARPDMIRSCREAADVSKAVLAALREREAKAEAMLGSSNPADIGNALMLMPDDAYAQRADKLAGIRLLPLGTRVQNGEDVMQKQVDSWIEAGGPYFNLKPNSWIGLLHSVLGSVRG
jgi:Restriction endonuclease